MSRLTEFEQFYNEHYAAIFYYALRLVEDQEACRDIVSDAMEQTWGKINDIDPERLKNFVYTLIHRKCVDHMRRQIAASRYVDFCLQLYDKEVVDNEWQEHEQLIETVMRLKNELSPRTRYVLEQCYFHHKRYSEVAEEMGISVNGVKKHIVTALKRLREEMAEQRH